MRTSLLVVSLLLACGATAAEKTFEEEVIEAIDRIAAQHGLPKEEGSHRARAIFNDSQLWPVKGGIALARKDIYVVVSAEKNGVMSHGEAAYGADAKSPQLFVFAGEKLVGKLAIPSGSEKDVLLALFTPERVRIFDWNKLQGGFYPRTQK